MNDPRILKFLTRYSIFLEAEYLYSVARGDPDMSLRGEWLEVKGLVDELARNPKENPSGSGH